uniref:Artemin n=1 Tax=Artemia salina TaxID=85549 RepID=A0AA50DEL3_ARTSA|nr:artemin [Artemia salina]
MLQSLHLLLIHKCRATGVSRLLIHRHCHSTTLHVGGSRGHPPLWHHSSKVLCWSLLGLICIHPKLLISHTLTRHLLILLSHLLGIHSTLSSNTATHLLLSYKLLLTLLI